MEKDDKEAITKFLNELSILTNKYGIMIGGCGCCGSPYLEKFNFEDFNDNGDKWHKDLQYIEKDGKYIVE